jgi:hypothetical protein
VGREAHRSKHSPVDRGGGRGNVLRVVGLLLVMPVARGCLRQLFVRRASMSHASTSVHLRVLAPMNLAWIAAADRRGALIGLRKSISRLVVAREEQVKARIAGAFRLITPRSTAAPPAFCADTMAPQFTAAFFSCGTRGVALTRIRDPRRAALRGGAPQYVNPGAARKAAPSD